MGSTEHLDKLPLMVKQLERIANALDRAYPLPIDGARLAKLVAVKEDDKPEKKETQDQEKKDTS